jgi:hypothetical protein
VFYLRYASLFAKSAREFRRLDSVSKSPLYSICEHHLDQIESTPIVFGLTLFLQFADGEAIAGVAVIRAFGSSARFMSLMLERCSTNVTFYWCE